MPSKGRERKGNNNQFTYSMGRCAKREQKQKKRGVNKNEEGRRKQGTRHSTEEQKKANSEERKCVTVRYDEY